MGEFEKRIDKLAFEVNKADLDRMVLPYGKTYSLLKQAKSEFPMNTPNNFPKNMSLVNQLTILLNETEKRDKWFWKWFGE